MKANPRYSPSSSQGFTLIELLTVIAIIGILAAIIIPTVGSVRQSAQSARALSNIKQIGLGNLLHAQENKNGILGEGWTWPDTNNLWNNMARYISKDPGNTNTDKTRLNGIIGGLVDPRVPENLQRYGSSPTDSFLTTWSCNFILNTMNGRANQGVTETRPSGGAPNYPRRRVMSEFPEPSRIIYMVGGSYQFDLTNAANEAFLVEPVARQRIFYYHGSNRATPAVFLDGHTQLLKFPIDPKLINPNAS
jgi:prepilin-type N-terminal cleavage/methylation domain-containing protein